jgi:hypothetical protein
MLTRRIVASTCALALALPVAASARPGLDAPPPKSATPAVSYGDTKYDLQNRTDLGAPVGDTKGDLHVVVPKLAAPATAPKATSNDGTNGWRIAAVAEAGVLAALALGGGLALGGHHAPRRRLPA